jgi:hypothetical protein
VTQQAVEFCVNDLPGLFAKGVEQLRERAATSERARKRLNDVMQASHGLHICFEGEPAADVYLAVDQGVVTVSTAAPSNGPRGHTIALPGAVVVAALSFWHALDGASHESRAHWATAWASKKAMDIFGKMPHAFDVDGRTLPIVDEARIRIALGTMELPVRPDFTVLLSYEELVAARARGQDLLQLWMGGKLKFQGDMGKAMTLAMGAMQLR